MVRIHVKHGGGGSEGEEWEFLYECQSICQIEEIADEIVRISNLQLKLGRLLLELEPRLLASQKNTKAIPLIRALSEAKSYASKDQVLNNKAVSYYVLKNHVQAMEREVKENYQLLGFENCNQVQELLTGAVGEKLDSAYAVEDFSGVELYQEETTQLHWAGKHLVKDKRLCDYIGMNDKTKIVLRLHPA